MLKNEKKLLETQFVLCIENGGCEDLEKRKLYQILPDEKAAQEGYLRIVDESQEDYLYPESYFIFLELPRKAQEALVATGWVFCIKEQGQWTRKLYLSELPVSEMTF